MGLLLKRDDITDFLDANDIYDHDEIIVWSKIGNVTGPYAVLVFNSLGFFTLPITPAGRIEGSIIQLESDMLDWVELRKKLLSYRLILHAKDPDIEIPPFHINKLMIGYRDQAMEIRKIIERFQIQ
ncbi:hypothetical protein G7062_03170 [Erysipelothrix sp. HDW6C]|uniref:hypothetical protein n=1 Tax=Erysipelothrix sp. HDW6C TaxID=2714930 RepID=UPI00140AFFA5|nr:hypothetical protein [Erysipelothrix sp. HDW6C]QIK69355.1 hypothetical protein G7062_03170 [Erysipelothrix sp. HDW6C]